MLASLVPGFSRHPHRFDGPEHPDADLATFEGRPTALEIEPRQPALRLGEGRFQGLASPLEVTR